MDKEIDDTETYESKFVFIQSNEFSEPFYSLIINGELYGHINYVNGFWQGSLRDGFVYSSVTFYEMAEKIDELNANLIEERKEYFGLL